MKLYLVDVMNDCEISTVLVVAKSEEEAKNKAYKLDWACYMDSWAHEIDDIEGYKVTFKKGKKINLSK
jgi:hypothetical protein